MAEQVMKNPSVIMGFFVAALVHPDYLVEVDGIAFILIRRPAAAAKMFIENSARMISFPEGE